MRVLDLYITKVCNLNCEYCYVDLVSDETPFEYKKFTSRINLLDYDHIKFYGWEPLLRWKEIQDIVDILAEKEKKMQYTIVTNGILLNEEKIRYCLENNIEIIISLHKKWISKIIKRLPWFLIGKRIIGFSFVFEWWNIQYPYKIISLLQKLWFINFVISPEIYTHWNTQELERLKVELDKLFQLYVENQEINFQALDNKHLKEVIHGCEKTIIWKDGEYHPCNRFKDRDKLDHHGIPHIYHLMNKYIDYDRDPYKWFYVCPIGWFLDSLNTQTTLEERIYQYRDLNHVLVDFYKRIHAVHGSLGFLSDNISEIRFNLTAQCNIRCEYCYVDFANKTLDIKKAKNIIDFYISQDGNEKVISLFWGEPLLEFDLLKTIVEYSGKRSHDLGKHISFKVATNFMLINKQKAQFLSDNNFEVHISFNGKKEINDVMRDNSTDLVLSHLDAYQDIIWKENIVILLAFSDIEVSSLFENVAYMRQLGFMKINLELIFGGTKHWTTNKMKILATQLQKIHTLEDISIMNLNSDQSVLDISVDWEASDNSLEFYSYAPDRKMKAIFDSLLQKYISKDT